MLIRVCTHPQTVSTIANPKPDRKLVNAYRQGRPMGYWVERDVTPEQFRDLVTQGQAFSFNIVNLTFEGGQSRPTYSLKSADGFALDIDSLGGRGLEAIPQPLLNQAFLVYRSPSYSEIDKKYRLCFRFPSRLENDSLRKQIINYFNALLSEAGADRSSFNTTRFFYGALSDAPDVVEVFNPDALIELPSQAELDRITSEFNVPKKDFTKVTSHEISDSLSAKVLRELRLLWNSSGEDLSMLFPGWELEAKPVASNGSIARWHCSNPFSESNSTKTSLCISEIASDLPPVFSSCGVWGGDIILWQHLLSSNSLTPEVDTCPTLTKKQWMSAVKDIYRRFGAPVPDFRRTKGTIDFDIDELSESFWSRPDMMLIDGNKTNYWRYRHNEQCWQLDVLSGLRFQVKLHIRELGVECDRLGDYQGIITAILDDRLRYGRHFSKEYLSSLFDRGYPFSNGYFVRGELYEYSPEVYNTFVNKSVSYVPSNQRRPDIERIAFKTFRTYLNSASDAQTMVDFSKLIVANKQHQPRKYLMLPGVSQTGKSACVGLLANLLPERYAGSVSAVNHNSDKFERSFNAEYRVLVLDETYKMHHTAISNFIHTVTHAKDQGIIQQVNNKHEAVREVVVPTLYVITSEGNPFDNVHSVNGLYERMLPLEINPIKLEDRGLKQVQFWNDLQNFWADWVSHCCDSYWQCDELVEYYSNLKGTIFDARRKAQAIETNDFEAFLSAYLLPDAESKVARDELVEAFLNFQSGRPIGTPLTLDNRDYRAVSTHITRLLQGRNIVLSNLRFGEERKRGFMGIRLATKTEVENLATSPAENVGEMAASPYPSFTADTADMVYDNQTRYPKLVDSDTVPTPTAKKLDKANVAFSNRCNHFPLTLPKKHGQTSDAPSDDAQSEGKPSEIEKTPKSPKGRKPRKPTAAKVDKTPTVASVPSTKPLMDTSPSRDAIAVSPDNPMTLDL